MLPEYPQIVLPTVPVPLLQAPQTDALTLSADDWPDVTTKTARLMTQSPWTRTLGKWDWTIQTEGWKFPAPPPDWQPPAKKGEPPPPREGRMVTELVPLPDGETIPPRKSVRVRPTAETVLMKDRLLYLLQPPLEGVFDGRTLDVPFEPFPYQLEGIAFLMPRHSALLADEMGLGKTMQTILSLRLLFHQRLAQRVLLITPKPLVHNWSREIKLWAPEMPFEVISGDGEERRRQWMVSNCPLKLINYETLCRDAEILADPALHFDIVVLDEAQRIKNHGSKTATVVNSIKRARSWALTGTPIENHPDDLINIFRFVDSGRIPADCPAKKLSGLVSDCILRRTKDDVQSDMPPKMIQDVEVDLTAPQREAYDRAEKDGIVHLNELGETITVQHVFQLVMRLKQICNFDPLTRQSAKLEQLVADMEEIAESGRKAIVFSQWVEPLKIIAESLRQYNPLEYHGRIPQEERNAILDEFKADPSRHVLLMTYGTGSVGLNLQFTNYVFLFDRWWNPAVEDQAINRAHRIGQRHPVTVTRFLTENTIEKRIADILTQKRKIFNDLLANAEKPSSIGLTEDEIFGLFDLNTPPKKAG
ncbi:MAG: DEAD/DEAH box helicase [Gemmataceae bacterium]